MSPLALLVIGGVVVTVGDVVLKKWATLHISITDIRFIVGILISMVGIAFLAWAFRSKGLATANIIFVTVNTLGLLFAHVFYFNERLTWLQGAGIALAVLAVFLIEYGETA